MRAMNKNPGWFYTVPFGALILFTTNNFSTGTVEGESYDSAVSGAFTMYIRLAIYCLSIYLFLIRPKANFSLLARGWAFLLVLLFVALSIVWSSFPVNVFVSCIHLVGAGLAAFAASHYFSKHSEHILPYISIVIGTSVVVSVITVFALPDIGLESFEWEEELPSRWRGATGNANGLGRLSALAIWAGLAVLISTSFKSNKLKFFVHGVILLASIASLINSESRTSQIVTVIIVVLSFFLPHLLSRRAEKRKKLYLILGFATLIIVSIASIYSYRLESDKATAYSHAGRDSDMSGRASIWEDARELINLKPFVGWGFDGDRSARAQIEFGVPHFHSGYYDILVQGGLVGALIFAIFYLRAFWMVFRLVKFNPNVYAPLLAFLIGILVFNITEVTFGAWSETVWILQLLVFFVAESKLRKKRKSRNKVLEEKLPYDS